MSGCAEDDDTVIVSGEYASDVDDFEHVSAEDAVPPASEQPPKVVVTPISEGKGALGYATSTVVLTTAAAIATALAGFHIGKTMCKAAAAGANGAYQHFIDSDPTKPETWQPSSYFAPFMSGAASTGVVEVFRRFKGTVEEVDLDTIILNAENWVALADEAAAENRGGLSSDQRNIAVAWIAEARRRLDEYIKCHSTGLHAILGPDGARAPKKSSASTPAAAAATDAASSPKEGAESIVPVPAPVVTFGAVVPVPAPAPVTNSPNQRVTIGAMLELARKDANSRNPSKDQLAQEDADLLNLIQALDNLVREVPIHVSRITSEQCEDNIRRSRALGSREFISAMQSRARVMVRNLWLPPKDRNKKFLNLASGAGTGKSTTFRQAIEEWARYPLRVITGSEFASMAIPEGSTAFQMFAKRFMALVRECPFKNPVFYGDDFDRALLGAGIFAVHKSCRNKLFLFFKDLCDPTISTIFRSEPELFSYELAPGRFFPIDASDMHWGMSCNSVPPELLPATGDKAMLARMANLTPRYADEEDRRTIALEFTLPKLLETIEAFYGADGKAQVARIDMEVARQTLLEVTQADIDKYTGTFHRKLGIRGIKDLLDRYSVYVESRLTRPHVDPRVFALSDGFRIADIVASIEAYQCGVDADMDAIEQAQALSQQLSDERLALQTLPAHLRADAAAQLDKVALINDVEKKLKLLQNIRTSLHLIRNRIPLPLPTEAGKRLDQALGYFRSDGGVSGDVNRFNQIYPVFENIYWRVRASRRGKWRPNRLIRVRFTDPSAETDSLFRDLAGALGGLPVRYLHSQASLFEVVDEFSVYESHPSYEGAINLCAKRNKSEGRLYVNDPVNGTVFAYLNQSPGVKIGSSVFYYKVGTRQYLLKAGGLDAAIAFAGTGNYVIWPSGCEPLSITVGEDVEQMVLKRAPKRCNLADTCFRKEFLEVPSAQEALVVLKLTETVRKQIVLFMSMQSGSSAGGATSSEASTEEVAAGDASTTPAATASSSEKRAAAQVVAAAREAIALRQFENWLVERLNEPQWTLAGGQQVDPRALTLFLVEPSSMNAAPASSSSDAADASSILDWLIGTPPIEGREKRARAALDADLCALNTDVQARTALLLEHEDGDEEEADGDVQTTMAPPSAITLSAEQQEVIRTLMAFDKQRALEARALGGVLSPVPLDRAVGDFVNLLRSSVNSFGLQTDVPSIEGFQQSWRELYQPELDRLNAAVEQRKLEEARRQRAKQEAAELERIQTMARLTAEHHAASTKANQVAYQRQFASSRNRSRSPSPGSSRLPCYAGASFGSSQAVAAEITTVSD